MKVGSGHVSVLSPIAPDDLFLQRGAIKADPVITQAKKNISKESNLTFMKLGMS